MEERPDLLEEGPSGLSLHCLHLYHKAGSLAQVSKELGVPIYQLKQLTKQPWWEEELQLLRQADKAAADVALSQLLDASLSELSDRLANGEKRVNKAGIMYRSPLSTSTLVRVMEAVFEKRQLIREAPTHISSEHGKLQELAAQLASIGEKKKLLTLEGNFHEKDSDQERGNSPYRRVFQGHGKDAETIGGAIKGAPLSRRNSCQGVANGGWGSGGRGPAISLKRVFHGKKFEGEEVKEGEGGQEG